MRKVYKQISIKPGFMKNNGGLLFRELSEVEYEFKTTINEKHLNVSGITHGGYIASIIDAGSGTGAYRSAGNVPCVTVSLDIKFIGATKLGDEIIGLTKIQKKTKTLIFLDCQLQSNEKIIASASDIWKVLSTKTVSK